MEKYGTEHNRQTIRFGSLEELINWAKKEYNAENFVNVNRSSFLEIVDWRK